jgi:hypothetical protein
MNLVSDTLFLPSHVFSYIHLEEVLLDFCELKGEHSGEHLAEAVWNVIQMYGLQNKVCPHLQSSQR